MKSTLKRHIYKNLLVFFQFVGIIIIAFTGSFFANNILLLILEICGIILAVWALISMKFSNLNVYPDIREGAKLVKSGPYRIIRHPMYSSIILAITPLVIDQFTWFRLSVYLIMFVDLIIKLKYEESMLKAQFIDYEEYCKKTFRIIPFIY